MKPWPRRLGTNLAAQFRLSDLQGIGRTSCLSRTRRIVVIETPLRRLVVDDTLAKLFLAESKLLQFCAGQLQFSLSGATIYVLLPFSELAFALGAQLMLPQLMPQELSVAELLVQRSCETLTFRPVVHSIR
jgi:hypothetical protein